MRAIIIVAALLAPLAAHAASLRLTPAQTEGPFYPVRIPADHDGDLVVVKGRLVPAKGQVLLITGQVVDRGGVPKAGAMVEIWQTDSKGRYDHPRAPGARDFDKDFQGYGRVVTDAEGRYRFRTLRPAPYPGRTPHVHVAVKPARGARLVTQLYFADESGNARDDILRELSAADRALLVRTPAPSAAEAGAHEVDFRIVLP